VTNTAATRENALGNDSSDDDDYDENDEQSMKKVW